MADSTTSIYMGFQIPTVGVDPGPDWATNINGALTIIDQHTHQLGSGQQITPAALNINADVQFNGHNLGSLLSTVFNSQGSPLGSSAVNCLSVSAGNLYYNDSSGTSIQITSGGAVNATSSGISSGTASASFSGGVLVVNQNTATPGNIQAGSILIGNNVASSNFTTLSAASSLAASYTITLPAATQGFTGILQMDSSGNVLNALQVDASTIVISSNTLEVPDGGITNPKLAALGQVATTGSGFQSTSVAAPSLVAILNQSASITTTGRPVMISIQTISTTVAVTAGQFTAPLGGMVVALKRDGTLIASWFIAGSSNAQDDSVPASIQYVDTGASAAAHTYALFMASGSATVSVNNIHMVIFEL